MQGSKDLGEQREFPDVKKGVSKLLFSLGLSVIFIFMMILFMIYDHLFIYL